MFFWTKTCSCPPPKNCVITNGSLEVYYKHTFFQFVSLAAPWGSARSKAREALPKPAGTSKASRSALPFDEADHTTRTTRHSPVKVQKKPAVAAELKKCSTNTGATDVKSSPTLIQSYKGHGWQFFKFKRSTSGLPYNKFIGPGGKTFWTNSSALAAGFKMEWLTPQQ